MARWRRVPIVRTEYTLNRNGGWTSRDEVIGDERGAGSRSRRGRHYLLKVDAAIMNDVLNKVRALVRDLGEKMLRIVEEKRAEIRVWASLEAYEQLSGLGLNIVFV